MRTQYDVIVIGSGHAGIEAAHAAARMGVCVLLCTIDRATIGELSCNPAVGGVAKGHLVKEVDALGGLIGRLTDSCALSYRRLNKSKGKAVWSTRAQVDRFLYASTAHKIIEAHEGITILEASVCGLFTQRNRIRGIETDCGEKFTATAVIICAGTFLNSTIHIGMKQFPGGRLYEPSSDKLFASIKRLGFTTQHFKTGTCARLDGRTVDFSKMTEQPPDYDVEPFSFANTRTPPAQVSCFITHTNEKTHRIIRRNLARSPLYTGKIKSRGVRYCPSLEDKVVKFSDRERHHVFIEPEGKETVQVYPNGVSTSLPLSVQEEFIHSIKGLENARILKPGYGIEHGIIDPRQLDPTLESRRIQGLYFAGQVNGTTGYEEAAAQGIMAGVNAALTAKRQRPFLLGRHEAFIGVLIDDLVRKGVDEPYRMFTSRSEYRLKLRESNAHYRLADKAYSLGLIGKEESRRAKESYRAVKKSIAWLRDRNVMHQGRRVKAVLLLKRPQYRLEDIAGFTDTFSLDTVQRTEVEITIKYEGFLQREQDSSKIFDKFKYVKIPEGFDINEAPFLSREIRDKLIRLKPSTLHDALKISGVTPAAVIGLYNLITRRPKNTLPLSRKRR